MWTNGGGKQTPAGRKYIPCGRYQIQFLQAPSPVSTTCAGRFARDVDMSRYEGISSQSAGLCPHNRQLRHLFFRFCKSWFLNPHSRVGEQVGASLLARSLRAHPIGLFNKRPIGCDWPPIQRRRFRAGANGPVCPIARYPRMTLRTPARRAATSRGPARERPPGYRAHASCER